MPYAAKSANDPVVTLFVVAVASALVFSFLCSISEAVLLSVRHADIERLGNSRAGALLRKFKKEIDVPIAAILVLNTVANTTGASVAGSVYGNVFDPSTLWIFTLLFTLSILLFTEIVPKTLGVTFVGPLAAPVALGVKALTVVLFPVLSVTRLVSGLLRRGRAQPVTSLEEIRLLTVLGRAEGAVGARAAQIIEGAAALRKLRARDVMVPRTSVRVLSGQRSLEENLMVVRRSGHSRFPFSPTGSLDAVTGVVLTKDLLFHLHDGALDPSWERLGSPPLMVSAAMPLDQLLLRFQNERRHMALVLDEYGGTQGLVTLEDILEEIVGEIVDETDQEQEALRPGPDGILVCSGRAEARKVLEAFGACAQFDSTSIGGVVADKVGRVPLRGDRIQVGGLLLEVVQASARRAERVRVRLAEQEGDCVESVSGPSAN